MGFRTVAFCIKSFNRNPNISMNPNQTYHKISRNNWHSALSHSKDLFNGWTQLKVITSLIIRSMERWPKQQLLTEFINFYFMYDSYECNVGYMRILFIFLSRNVKHIDSHSTFIIWKLLYKMFQRSTTTLCLFRLVLLCLILLFCCR